MGFSQESGMMTYGDNRRGAVLSFGCGAPNATIDAYIRIVSNSSGAQPYPSPMLRMDLTNCGVQRSDVAMYNADCAVQHTNRDNVDALCYCEPAPCVLKSTAPLHTTWFLNAAESWLPVPSAYFGTSGELVARATAMPPQLSGSTYSGSVTIITATVEFLPKGAQPSSPAANATGTQ